MEKLDYTLYYILKHKLFTRTHIYKLNAILERLSQIFYKHHDLHFNNTEIIIWSKLHNDFRIIDWGFIGKLEIKR